MADTIATERMEEIGKGLLLSTTTIYGALGDASRAWPALTGVLTHYQELRAIAHDEFKHAQEVGRMNDANLWLEIKDRIDANLAKFVAQAANGSPMRPA